MSWLVNLWNGRGRQRQQVEESAARLSEESSSQISRASLRSLAEARADTEDASKCLQEAVHRRFAASEPLRRVLNELLARVSEDRVTAKDRR
jgi:CRISPR/Cas system CSM-associated protein Csm2 small subunit